jgi:ADP-ribosylglycohydrolase
MQHSLRHRFRGAVLGAALGETLGMNCADRSVTQEPLPWITVHNWGFQVPSSASLPWGKRASTQLAAFLPTDLASQTSHAYSPLDTHALEVANMSSSDRVETAGLAIASLPIALFYHEDWQQLQHSLEQTLSTWQPTSGLTNSVTPLAGVLVISYGIALALRERLHPRNFLARLTIDLDLQDRDPVLLQQLNQIQQWLNNGTELTTIQSMLKDGWIDRSSHTTPIALALYGFLSTPTNFRLSLLRTAQLQCQPQVACGIVGALSGAYNSLSGLPKHWRKLLRSIEPSPVWVWGATSEADLLRQADLLWAAWSGAYNPAEWLAQVASRVTASPHVIRPR